tara:strand:- start:1347 stop:1985 length:639 start_codon:yes stop_codon:yes gene_type:complete
MAMMSNEEMLNDIITMLDDITDNNYTDIKNYIKDIKDSDEFKDILMGTVPDADEQLFDYIIYNKYYDLFEELLNIVIGYECDEFNAIMLNIHNIFIKDNDKQIIKLFEDAVYKKECQGSKQLTKDKLIKILINKIKQSDGKKKERLIAKLKTYGITYGDLKPSSIKKEGRLKKYKRKSKRKKTRRKSKRVKSNRKKSSRKPRKKRRKSRRKK